MSHSSGNPPKVESSVADESRPQQTPVPHTVSGQATSPDRAAVPQNETTSSGVSEPVDETEETTSSLWLLPSDRWFIGVLAGIAFLLMTIHWARLSGWGLDSIEIDRHPTRQYEYKIDINKATWVEWVQLDGIGNVLAKRIVDDRKTNGPFESIDDVQRVKGIGPKTLKKFRSYLFINKEPNNENKPQESQRRNEQSGISIPQSEFRIPQSKTCDRIFTASATTIRRGISGKLSSRVIDCRKRRRQLFVPENRFGVLSSWFFVTSNV